MDTMEQAINKYYKRDFWAIENLKYVAPHFRLEKSARIVNKLAKGRECDLLDVGCGPATLMRLLHENVHYHGIDMAVHSPAPNLAEFDFLSSPIKFADKKFDIVLAQGVFEYVGKFQSEKFVEIERLLKANGTFIVSYVNFNHVNRVLYEPYNNVQSLEEFRKSLARFFHVNRVLPTSHHWHHREPSRWLAKKIHMHINVPIPLITQLFAIEYFFICSSSASWRRT
jgi:cyclopropane fatty-acyl-phospholipid synthase-like methyltransferase